MSHKKSGNIFLHSIKEILLLCVKIIIIVFAWCCKGAGYILGKIGELTVKLVEK